MKTQFEHFPNRAGNAPDNDSVIAAELASAGIPTLEQVDGEIAPEIRDLLRNASGEVATYVRGTLCGWSFQRGWRYWVCTGPGIPLKEAEELHACHGQSARVNGDASAPSPREQFHGLGCGAYHVDGPDALKALADTIKAVVKNAERQIHE